MVVFFFQNYKNTFLSRAVFKYLKFTTMKVTEKKFMLLLILFYSPQHL